MDTEQMGEARSIVANPWNYLPSLRPWAEALLAEHEARVAVEWRADEDRGRALEAIRQAEVRAEKAERELNEAKAAQNRLAHTLAVEQARVATLEAERDALRDDWALTFDRRKEAETRAEQAERQRANAEGKALRADYAAHLAGERVATLEAALRQIRDRCRGDGLPTNYEIARAALGDQAAPTEPTDVEVVEFHMTHAGAAPQAAPEPERCPRCDSGDRMKVLRGCEYWKDDTLAHPWHSAPPLTGNCEDDCQTACAYPGQFAECDGVPSAPLVEGEQGD